MVKAQVLAGGRGKGTLSSGLQGGVKLTKESRLSHPALPTPISLTLCSPEAAIDYARQMVGYRIVTKQTPKEGVPIHKVSARRSWQGCEEMHLWAGYDSGKCGPAAGNLPGHRAGPRRRGSEIVVLDLRTGEKALV